MGEVRRRRPWLAVLLALVISGLGHAYLRRWGRALGWYVAITATVVFLVPDGAVDGLFAGTTPPLADIAPALVVVVASVIDAYVLAVRNNRKYDRQQAAYGARELASGDVKTDAPDVERGRSATGAASGLTDRFGDDAPSDTGSQPAVDCPHCGREVDPDLDFCHWCTERLSGAEKTSEE